MTQASETYKILYKVGIDEWILKMYVDDAEVYKASTITPELLDILGIEYDVDETSLNPEVDCLTDFDWGDEPIYHLDDTFEDEPDEYYDYDDMDV